MLKTGHNYAKTLNSKNIYNELEEIECSSEGNYKQGEKTALRMGENNSKRSNRQRINLKNTQATPPAQLQKNK